MVEHEAGYRVFGEDDLVVRYNARLNALDVTGYSDLGSRMVFGDASTSERTQIVPTGSIQINKLAD